MLIFLLTQLNSVPSSNVVFVFYKTLFLNKYILVTFYWAYYFSEQFYIAVVNVWKVLQVREREKNISLQDTIKEKSYSLLCQLVFQKEAFFTVKSKNIWRELNMNLCYK